MERGESTEEHGRGSKQNDMSTNEIGEKEVIMETQQADEDDAGVVKLTVSHASMIENLWTLGATRTVIQNGGPQSQVQSGGPKKSSQKTLKEITNMLDVRPTVVKNSKPGSKVNGVQINKEFRILKRSGEVWRGEETNGPPTKSPFERSSSNRLPQVDELGGG